MKTGTLMAGSPLPLLTWLYAIYLDSTSLKGVSSMKLRRDLGLTQKAAWHMLQRIREAFIAEGPKVVFDGPAEIDGTYAGGKQKNRPKSKREKLEGRSPMGKTAVVGAKDRKTGKIVARVVKNTDAETLQGLVEEHTAEDAQAFIDDAAACKGLPNYSSVKPLGGGGT